MCVCVCVCVCVCIKKKNVFYEKKKIRCNVCYKLIENSPGSPTCTFWHISR